MKAYLEKFSEQIRERSSETALSDYQGSSYTYAQVAQEIERIHLFLEAAGIRKGDKIALVAKSSARWAIWFLAINTFQAVVVPILPNFTPEGATSLVNHSDSTLMIADQEIWKNLNRSDLPRLRGVLGAADNTLLWADEDILAAWEKKEQLFRDRHPQGFNPADVSYPSHQEDLAIINYTSGTSGSPKGVMLTFGALSDMVEYCQQHICSQAETIISMLPLAHIYGLVMEFIYPTCTGFSIHFLGKTPSPTLLVQSMQEIRPTLIVTVPLVMEKLCKKYVGPALSTRAAKLLSAVPGARLAFYKGVGDKVMEYLGGRVRTIIIGGAPLSWKVEGLFRKIGLPYAIAYGMTEACPLLSLESPERHVSGSCGKPVHELRIDSSDPERIPGEIQARGPNLFIGYYKNPQADALSHTADGWLRTGDLGVMDENGNLFIRGRIKALILSASGQNIYPEEVEQVLEGNPQVIESLVLEREGKIVALVYAQAHGDTDPDRLALDIRNQANRHLPRFSQIFRVELVDLPFERTAKGSIKRHLYK